MRTAPLPLLRDLAVGTVVGRCSICGWLVTFEDVCRTDGEAKACLALAPKQQEQEA